MKEIPSGGEEPIIKRLSESEEASERQDQIKKDRVPEPEFMLKNFGKATFDCVLLPLEKSSGKLRKTRRKKRNISRDNDSNS